MYIALSLIAIWLLINALFFVMTSVDKSAGGARRETGRTRSMFGGKR